MNDNHTNVPGDLELLRPWLPLVRRLRREYDGSGVTIVSARVVIDEHGCPALFAEPTSTRLYPGINAEAALRALLAGLAGKE